MKLLVFVVGLSLASAARLPFPVDINSYHEKIGIPEYERLKQAGEAQDFDGSRIIGGQISALGEHPHLAGLIVLLTTGQSSLCGSSLLTNTKLVTAAHCWWTNTHQGVQVTVILGSTNINFGGVRRTTNNVQTHNFNPYTVENDVAVITISYVGFTNHIQPIALATGSNQYIGSTAIAAGYGAISDSPWISNSVKRHAELLVVNNSVCASAFGSAYIFPSTLCVSTTNGRSTCFGDSGGPLAVGSGSNRVLIGITSFGGQFCQRGIPAAFARVTSFASWIQARL
ncbi:collagenase-like [Melitaea cinxia]|uniref:collagenase-like n=1 Tax=Melitaea cinxia TaxID=113334 RepID=UPI001E26EE38|nr:collagenase-like [Melitaea cinxia]